MAKFLNKDSKKLKRKVDNNHKERWMKYLEHMKLL